MLLLWRSNTDLVGNKVNWVLVEVAESWATWQPSLAAHPPTFPPLGKIQQVTEVQLQHQITKTPEGRRIQEMWQCRSTLSAVRCADILPCWSTVALPPVV